MSEETWLYAVLIAARADSTSGGGSIPVISDASNTIPYRAGEDRHSRSMCSLRSRRFFRRSLMEIPWTTDASARPEFRARGGFGRRFKVGDSLAQHRDEVA